MLADHKENLEKETREKKEKLDKQEKKLQHWKLYKECKSFLENNDKNWENRKIERELDRKRKERLHIAEEKREKLKERVKKRKLETEIEEKMAQLPAKEREKMDGWKTEERKN